MRVIFAGTPEVAVPTLRALAAEHDVVAVLTRTPAPIGRKRVLTSSPVAAAAHELEIPVIESDRPDDAVTDRIEQLGAELGVVVAYGAMLRQRLLTAPANGWINLHFSQLPAYRGAAPLQRMIIDGHTRAAMTVFQLVEQLDAGPVYRSRSVELGYEETASEAFVRLAEEGASLVATTVDSISSGSAVPTPQIGGASYAPKLTRADGYIDFSLSADVVHARFKGVTEEPGAYSTTEAGDVKILALARTDGDSDIERAVATLRGNEVIIGSKGGAFKLLRVQPAGKPAMAADAWLRGRGGSVRFLAEGTTA